MVIVLCVPVTLNPKKILGQVLFFFNSTPWRKKLNQMRILLVTRTRMRYEELD